MTKIAIAQTNPKILNTAENLRVILKMIEDANKNGAFDKNDIMHYHFIDLSEKEWKVTDYNLK